MREFSILCVLVISMCNVAVTVDPGEGFRALQSSFNRNSIERLQFQLFQNETVNDIINEIKLLAELANSADSLCATQLNHIITEFQTGRVWAMKFFDSWGKIPSGILWGHFIEMGNFDECLSIEHTFLLDGNIDSIHGQYCMASIPVSSLLTNVAESLTAFGTFKVGLCLPRSCEATFTNKILRQTLLRVFKVNTTMDIVNHEKCIQSRTPEFETIDWIAITIFSLIVLVIVCCTILDSVSKVQARNVVCFGVSKPLILAFSLSENMKLLFRTTSKRSPNVIGCLNGMRSLSIVWIIFGHSYMMSMFLPNINPVEISQWAQTPFSMFLQSGTISVDTFFFLSGLLLIWAGLKEMEKTRGKLNIVVMYLHRYIRLTPVVAGAMLLFVSLYRHMGDGPLWNGFTSTYQLCHETWWATLLYVQNYAAAGKMCLGHTWYLAVDMQMYILSPLILIPIFKWRKKAVAAVSVFGLLLVACLFTTIVLNNYTVFSTTGNLGADNEEMRKLYYSTHVRASPWLIGIIFGYFLYNNRNKRIKIGKAAVIGGWLLSLALLGIGIFALYPITLPGAKPLTSLEGAFYLSLSRVAWPLALSWIVFACVNGYGGFVHAFLSWTFWQPMARLSYCMYIFHLFVETIHGGRTRVNVHFSDYDVILRFWGDFGITLLASTVAYLMLESPMVGVEKMLFGPKIKNPVTDATISKQNLCDNES